MKILPRQFLGNYVLQTDLKVNMRVSNGNRILMLLENNPYPQDTRVRQEARSLVEADYQVTVICPSTREQTWRENLDGVCVYRFPAPFQASSFLGYLWEFGYSMVAIFILSLLVYFLHGFDVVHTHCPPDTFVIIAIFYKLLGKRYVYDHHDLAPELYNARFDQNGSKLVYNILLWFEKLSCQHADLAIATNESYKSVEIQRGHLSEDCISIVRNGPDLNYLQSLEINPFISRKGKLNIVYVGAMGFQDGVDYLLRALHLLVHDLSIPDFCCVLVGDGVALQGLKSLTEHLSLTNHVTFTGWVNYREAIDNIISADICVAPEPLNPYNDQSTIIKIMEYMALEKPIVAFDLKEHRVTAQDAALYAHPNDELDFAKRIAELMGNPEKRQRMGQSGKYRVETALAWKYQEKHLIEAYARICDHQSKVV
jgi:glycosyltransferase involved in cell wall biosynthesis